MANCAPGFRVASATRTADRVCAPCTGLTYANGTNQINCTDVTICGTSQYAAALPTSSSDRVCAACTVCQSQVQPAGTYYRAGACNSTANSVCMPCVTAASCLLNQYKKNPKQTNKQANKQTSK